MSWSQLLLLVTTSLLAVAKITVATQQQDAVSGKVIEKEEDENIPLDYNTYHRYQGEHETTWPKKEELPTSTKCGPGFYEQCLPCPLGYYKQSKKNKPCDLCGSGSGTPNVGAGWCTRFCKPGFRLLEDGKKKKRTCTECETGFYQPYFNVDYNCVPCPSNMVTEKKGRKSIHDCFLNCTAGQQPNSYNTACILCPEGTYKRGTGGSDCTKCSKNRTTVADGATDGTQCQKPCEPGREYNKTSGKCDIKCQRGTYKNVYSSRTKCRPCPKNFVPNKDKAATDCVLNCGPGYEINGSQDNCTACEFGFFKTGMGNSLCQTCPGNQMTISKATTDSGDCKVFNDCAKPLSQKLEFMFSKLDGLMAKSDSFIDFMVNTCRLGPLDILVELLEDVVASFQICGVVGQINLRAVEIGGKIYNKEHYLKIFQTAYSYGGICNFVLCLIDTVPEIRWSKLWIGINTCPPTETHCFCSVTYRALATSFHTHLKNCPALQFHAEFLEVNIGGTEMMESLLGAPNITMFCALSNGCGGVDCGHGSCSSLVSGGYGCRCMFGYTGDNCQTALVPTQATEPDITTKGSRTTNVPPTCPPSAPCPDCPKPEPPTSPPSAPCPECPKPPEPPMCPTSAPCPECPKPPEPPTCPTSAPCPECPKPTDPPTCPTSAPCPECQKQPEQPTCPTHEPCQECPKPTEPPTCTTSAPCPDCPKPTEPTPCPTTTHCPVCPKPTESLPCPTITLCPVCPKATQPLPCPTCTSCPEPTPCPTETENPISCLELLKKGNTRSGIYQIYIATMGRNVEVYCDQYTDGGGWIVFQRRKDGSVDFYRDWNDYKFGFGKLGGEFWLGLDILHHLTTSISKYLRIDLQNFDYEERYAQYSTFIVGSEADDYRLTSDGYTGNAGDSFGKRSGRHNGYSFSTKDVDNDAYSTSCANLYKGGWWYDACHRSNLNGLYLNGGHESYADGIEWYYWTGYHYSLEFTEMKVREGHDWTGTEKPTSCLELLKKGNTRSGTYQIYVASMGRNVEVYCDQETDGGGWIVFQRRQDGSIDFYRGWDAYKFGFGQRTGEFWLGLESLHHLTTSVSIDLRIDLQSFDNEKSYAKYSTFIVGSESSNYVLTSDGYTGDAGDSFGEGSGRHNGYSFSTKDVDNDAYSESCAQLYKGGWWYDACHRSNLNGLYLNGGHESYADGIEWYHWTGYHYSLKFTEMKIREKI